MIKRKFFQLNIQSKQVILFNGALGLFEYRYFSPIGKISYLFHILSLDHLNKSELIKQLFFRYVPIKKSVMVQHKDCLKVKLIFEEYKNKSDKLFLPFPYELIKNNIDVQYKIKYI